MTESENRNLAYNLSNSIPTGQSQMLQETINNEHNSLTTYPTLSGYYVPAGKLVSFMKTIKGIIA